MKYFSRVNFFINITFWKIDSPPNMINFLSRIEWDKNYKIPTNRLQVMKSQSAIGWFDSLYNNFTEIWDFTIRILDFK